MLVLLFPSANKTGAISTHGVSFCFFFHHRVKSKKKQHNQTPFNSETCTVYTGSKKKYK